MVRLVNEDNFTTIDILYLHQKHFLSYNQNTFLLYYNNCTLGRILVHLGEIGGHFITVSILEQRYGEEAEEVEDTANCG